ncbi:hypothetical protein ACIGQE_27985 [Streptomyces sp. NPDC053429]
MRGRIARFRGHLATRFGYGFWNSGTALTALLDLDIKRSDTNRKLSADN